MTRDHRWANDGRDRPRPTTRTWVAVIAACTALAMTAAPVAAEGRTGRGRAHGSLGPRVTELATFGSELGSGSTIGPDGALYVTDGNAGSVLRIDPNTGDVSTFAEGLPPQVLGIGGATDVVFLGRTAYVLVTMVGGDLVLPDEVVHFGDATNGIYRLEPDGTFTVVADIGAWSVANLPNTSYFITTGVHYALQASRGAFLVVDAHHNRVLRVTRGGEISPVAVFGNVAPTGLDVSGDKLYLAHAGPIPHVGEDAKVVAVRLRSGAATELASGEGEIGLAVDVELGPHGTLYALLQGDWDLPVTPENEGAPASPDTGALMRVERDGSFTTVVGGLDRPTSLELVGDTAFVVTLTGKVMRIDNFSHRPLRHRR